MSTKNTGIAAVSGLKSQAPKLVVAEQDLQRFWERMGAQRVLTHRQLLSLQQHLDTEGVEAALMTTITMVVASEEAASRHWASLGVEIGSEELKLAFIEELRPHVVDLIRLASEGGLAWVITLMSQHVIPLATAGTGITTSMVVFISYFAVCRCRKIVFRRRSLRRPLKKQ